MIVEKALIGALKNDHNEGHEVFEAQKFLEEESRFYARCWNETCVLNVTENNN